MHVEINNEIYPVTFVRKKVKRTFLKINRNKEIIITSPLKLSLEEIERIIEGNKNWLIKQLSKIKTIDLEEDQYLYFGKIYKIVETNKLKNNYQIDDDIIYYNGNGLGKLELEGYKVLEKVFYDIVREYGLKFVPMLQLRSMKSKWGVCHYTKNKVVINKVLIHMPIEYTFYIVNHELTHFFVPNHSKKFYSELEKHFPNHRSYQKEIKKYSFLLEK